MVDDTMDKFQKLSTFGIFVLSFLMALYCIYMNNWDFTYMFR